jgi:hypothetical protein
MKKKQTTYRLDVGLLERLMKQAEREHRSSTNLVEVLLSEGLAARARETEQREKSA